MNDGFNRIAPSLVLGIAGAACAADNHVLSLSAVGQYVTVPHSTSLAASDEITVEYWVRCENLAGVGRIGKTAPSHNQWGLEPSAAGLTMFNVSFAGSGLTAHPIGQWYHVAGTWNRATRLAIILINGHVMASNLGPEGAMNAVTYPIYIGFQPFFSNTQLYGAVDNFRVWRKARTDTQIRELMHVQLTPQQAALQPDLVLSLSFEDGAQDASAFSNHGAMIGGAAIAIDNSFLLPPDCDRDGVSDAEEIAKGGSDLDGNSVPDECQCLADVDGSGAVNAVDISVILSVWGTSGGKYPGADVDRNGAVDGVDLSAVLAGWGPCP